jgi:hypothetical protein
MLELAADNREVEPWKGARSPATTAYEAKHTHLIRARGLELDIRSEEDSRGERRVTVWRRGFYIDRRRKNTTSCSGGVG